MDTLKANESTGKPRVKPEKGGWTKKTTRAKVLDIVGIIIILLLIPLLVVDGVLLYKSVANPDIPADFMGYIPLVADNNNMADFDSNDLVVMKAVGIDETLEPGSIICYMYDGKVVWQRVVQSEVVDGRASYVVKADVDDEGSVKYVSSSQVLGVYHTHIDDIGSFVLFMQTRVGILVCVVLPIFILFITFYLIDKKRYAEALKAAEEKAAEAKSAEAE